MRASTSSSGLTGGGSSSGTPKTEAPTLFLLRRRPGGGLLSSSSARQRRNLSQRKSPFGESDSAGNTTLQNHLYERPSSSSPMAAIISHFQFYWVRPLGAPDTCRRWTVHDRTTTRRRHKHTHKHTQSTGKSHQKYSSTAVWSRPLTWEQLTQAVRQDRPSLTRLELDGQWRTLPQELWMVLFRHDNDNRTNKNKSQARLRTLVLCSPGFDTEEELPDDKNNHNKNLISLPYLLVSCFSHVTRLEFHGIETLHFEELTYLAKTKTKSHSLLGNAPPWLESIVWDGSPMYWNKEGQEDEKHTPTESLVSGNTIATLKSNQKEDAEQQANQLQTDGQEAMRNTRILQAWISLLETHQQSLRRCMILADHASVFSPTCPFWIPFLRTLTHMAVLQECRVPGILDEEEAHSTAASGTNNQLGSSSSHELATYLRFLYHVHTIRAFWQGEPQQNDGHSFNTSKTLWPRQGQDHPVVSQAMGVLETWYRDSHMPAILAIAKSAKQDDQDEQQIRHNTPEVDEQQDEETIRATTPLGRPLGANRLPAVNNPVPATNTPTHRGGTATMANLQQPQRMSQPVVSCWNRPRTLAERLAASTGELITTAPPRPALSEWVMPVTRRQDQQHRLALVNTTSSASATRSSGTTGGPRPRTLAELAGSSSSTS